MICKHCGSEVKDGVKFCPSCGKKTETVTPPQKKCEKCGNLLNDGVKFCPSCGTFMVQSSNAPKDETAAQEKDLTCTCGNKLKPGMKFCNVCGKKNSVFRYIRKSIHAGRSSCTRSDSDACTCTDSCTDKSRAKTGTEKRRTKAGTEKRREQK